MMYVNKRVFLRGRAALSLTHWLFDFVQDSGLQIQQASRDLGLPLTNFASDTEFVSYRSYSELFEWTAKALNNENIALDLAKSRGLNSLGVYGYLLSNSQTLAQAFQHAQRYFPIIQEDSALTCLEANNEFHISYQVTLPEVVANHQDVVFTLATCILFIRQYCGQDWLPTRVLLTSPPPSDTSQHKTVFGEGVHYNQNVNRIELPAQLLTTAIPNADPTLLSILEKQCMDLLNRASERLELSSYVRSVLLESWHNKRVDAESIATQLNMSRRTLNRYLLEEGYTFRQIKEGVLVELAKSALIESDASVTDIALNLGYSEISPFVRAFKRLTQQTPNRFRRTHRSTS